MTPQANLFIVAAPSGGGKTSLVKQVIANVPNLEVSVSHTTRPPRPGELEGVHYFFVSDKCFQEMIAHNEFIEHANVFSHYYGTSVNQIKARLAANIDVILDIDWQGAQQIKQLFPSAVTIFIIPPSLEVLTQRLHGRGQDNADVIQHRMRQAQNEMNHYTEFDYLICNDGFEQAVQELTAIIVADRLKSTRQVKNFTKLLSLLLTSK